MKQFKCSMSKKIERLGKKQEAISGKNLMDPEQFEKDIREMIDGEYEKILKGCDDKERRYYELAWEIWDDCGYDYAGELYEKLQQQMYKYVSGTDYKMSGNFANIAWDWDRDHKDGIKFNDLRKKLLDGVKDADTDEFSTWAIDWFFHAFGTYNMCYNFATDLGEEAATLEQEDEEERERENSDESKKSKATTEDISVKLTELKDVTNAGKVLDDLKKLGFNTIEYGDYALKDKAYAVLKHPNGMYAELDYTWVQDSSGRDSYSPGEVVAYDYFKDKDEYEEIHGYSPNESKKSEDASSVDDLLARHNQKWLVKVSYDVDASHSAVAPFIVRADTKDAATNIALKRHRGLGYNMKVVSVEPMTESRKKSEGISDMIDAKIDYNMFMRMCKTAAYLEEDEDYWDALWDFYSEVGSIGDALVFFDNLFQYTAWMDVDETYDELAESDQDGSKSKEECIEAVLDRDGEIRGSLVRNYGDHYLWVY